MQKNDTQFKPRKNHQIRALQVRVIDNEGVNCGVMSLQEALQQARAQNLDLIEINPKSIPVVVRIADYGKMLYEEKKKATATKKAQKVSELKELTFRPNTDEHDLAHKLELAKKFLADGNKVKFSIRFRGREMAHPQVGKEKLDWLLQQLSPLLSGTSSIGMEGKVMSMIVSPK